MPPRHKRTGTGFIRPIASVTSYRRKYSSALAFASACTSAAARCASSRSETETGAGGDWLSMATASLFAFLDISMGFSLYF